MVSVENTSFLSLYVIIKFSIDGMSYYELSGG